MKALIENVKQSVLQHSRASCARSYLNSTVKDPLCLKIVSDMQKLTPESLGCKGSDDPYCFSGDLNKIRINQEYSEDYQLALFFIKKGVTMPLHDHPNMTVFFRLVFGELKYYGYDKLDDKFKYNQFSTNEYEELLNKKTTVKAKRTKLMTIKKDT